MVGHYRTPTGEYFPTHGPVRTDTAGGWTKMSDEPLAREREPMSACGRAVRPWLWRTLLPAAVLDPSGQASLARCGHAERPVQGSWRQEYWAADAKGPRAQQAGKLETWALFAGSQGGTVASAGGNTCAPRSVQVDLTLRSRLPTRAKSSVPACCVPHPSAAAGVFTSTPIRWTKAQQRAQYHSLIEHRIT